MCDERVEGNEVDERTAAETYVLIRQTFYLTQRPKQGVGKPQSLSDSYHAVHQTGKCGGTRNLSSLSPVKRHEFVNHVRREKKGLQDLARSSTRRPDKPLASKRRHN